MKISTLKRSNILAEQGLSVTSEGLVSTKTQTFTEQIVILHNYYDTKLNQVILENEELIVMNNNMNTRLIEIEGKVQIAVATAKSAQQSALSGAGGGRTKKEVIKIIEETPTTMATITHIESPKIVNDYDAASLISGQKIVAHNGTNIYVANVDNINDAGKIIGMTTGAGIIGVDVISVGEYEDVSWSFTPGSSLYVGLNGNIVETIEPTSVFDQYIGKAITSTKVLLDFNNQPIRKI